MCGIAGIFYKDPRARVDESVLAAMVGSMHHRGPDDEGYFVDDGVGLAMCRLSILDLAGGHQPMSTLDGQLTVVQNGEIYNYVELRERLEASGHQFRTDSDTEVLLYAYRELGDHFPELLNGMFAIALYDRAQRRLVLVRDRVGKKPLYLWQDAEKLVFASEIKALLASGLVPATIDAVSLHHLLSYNYVPGPRTIFRGVQHVPPAGELIVTGSRQEAFSYWAVPVQSEEQPSERIVREFLDLFEDSVRIRLRSDVPLGIFLSGGLDSSAVAWAASRSTSARLCAFSIQFEGEEYDETPHARHMAEALGISHLVLPTTADLAGSLDRVAWHADQPHGDASFLALYEMSRAAHGQLKVALTGDGADELFGGYDWHWDSDAMERADDLAWHHIRFERNSVFSQDEKLALYQDDIAVEFAQVDSFSLLSEALEQADGLDGLNRLLYCDLKQLLPGNNLVKTDRMGMAHSLELRAPYLDYRIVEQAFRIPGPQKFENGVGKILLKQALQAHLPAGAVWRRKHMFRVPMREWLRNAESPLGQRLTDPGSPLYSFARPEVVQGLLDQHVKGERDHTRKLRLLLAIDAWWRAFLASAGSTGRGLITL